MEAEHEQANLPPPPAAADASMSTTTSQGTSSAYSESGTSEESRTEEDSTLARKVKQIVDSQAVEKYLSWSDQTDSIQLVTEFGKKFKKDSIVIKRYPEKQEEFLDEQERDAEAVDQLKILWDIEAKKVEEAAVNDVHKTMNDAERRMKERRERLKELERKQLEDMTRQFVRGEAKVSRGAIRRGATVGVEKVTDLEDFSSPLALLHRRFRLIVDATPRRIRISNLLLRAPRKKLTRGFYCIRVSLVESLGGKQLLYQSDHEHVRARLFSCAMDYDPDSPSPAFRFPDQTIAGEDIVVAVPPPRLHAPGFSYLFELVRSKDSKYGYFSDEVCGFAYFPISDSAFQLLEGDYKAPVLRGEVDSRVIRYKDIADLIRGSSRRPGLVPWLCNMYFSLEILPLPGESRPVTTIQATDARPRPEDASLPDVPEVPSTRLSSASFSDELSEAIHAASAAPAAVESTRKEVRWTDPAWTDPLFGPRSQQLCVDEDGEVDPDGENEAFLPAASRLAQFRRFAALQDRDRVPKKNVDVFVGSEIGKYRFVRPVRGPRRGAGSQSDAPPAALTDSEESSEEGSLGQQLKRETQNSASQLLKFHGTVRPTPVATKRMVAGRVKASFILRSFMPSIAPTVPIGVATLLSTLAFVYLLPIISGLGHYAALKMFSFPAYDLGVRILPYPGVDMSISITTLTSGLAVLSLGAGPVLLLIVGIVLVLLLALVRRLFVQPPTFMSRAVLPLVLAIPPAILLEAVFHTALNVPDNFLILAEQFESASDLRTVGLLISFGVYALFAFIGVALFVSFYLNVFRNGKIQDTYSRLNDFARVFFVPHDLELSAHELNTIFEQTRNTRLSDGKERLIYRDTVDLCDARDKSPVATCERYRIVDRDLNNAVSVRRSFLRILPIGSIYELFPGTLGECLQHSGLIVQQTWLDDLDELQHIDSQDFFAQ
eukprot:gnl/Chilomastix_cuspidata/830.p1 GENE.gnl/Chilomastix_cuspidata/830~~gnl/Chilomastix_cuspidata/830.p1  ORF type:complete len:1010 (-),score=414.69 gnl/Chilomastix_cuspidata/830:1463-4291(-)